MNIYNQKKKTDPSGRGESAFVAGNATLTAAALQDQILKNMGGLSLSDPLGQRRLPIKKVAKKKPARPVIDTGLTKQTSLKFSTEQPPSEFVLDAKPPPLTLAQKLGLVDAPPQPPSEKEWECVKSKSNARDDSREPCVICKEDFGTQEQVLLSCTHVFHKKCLQAFERFTGKKTCPMCRKEQYYTRVIHEGAREHRQKCAVKIQATWRGYVVRSWYKKLRETVPPKDPMLRQKFYEDKLHNITERMVKSLDYDVNRFLSDIDQSLEASRDIFRHFDNAQRIITDTEWEAIQLKAVERGEQDCPICLTALEKQGLVSKLANHRPREEEPSYPSATKSKFDSKPPRKDSKDAKGKSPTKTEGKEKNDSKQTRMKLLLSCSHVFHQTCLEAFEEFAVGESKFVCPVCRSNYQKKLL